jgi:hypothetical protein
MDLYYLIYSSIPAKVLNEEELHDLLAVSRTANEIHHVTGMLLCLSGMYIQLIEGPKAEIIQLYKNIRNDSRHYQVTTLIEGDIEARFFPDWHMGYDMSEKTLKEHQAAVDLTDPESIQLLQILERI